MSNFINAINTTYTENGALTNASSGSALLDYFGMGSALRIRKAEDKYFLFLKALQEDEILAIKTLFYTRDPRGGQGERQTFRDIFFQYAMEPEFEEKALNLLPLIPEFGRWDDLIDILYNLYKVGGSNEIIKEGLEIIIDRLTTDSYHSNPSLLAKWMPSANTSSKETRAKAKWLIDELSYTPKQYRQMLSKLRSKIDLVERKMSSNNWGEINYERVPSQASRIYRNAFSEHDFNRYMEYIGMVNEGGAKINTSVTYPYEIVREVMKSSQKDETLELIWKNLPDYTEGREENSIVVCDTSGSMAGLPLEIAVSLSIYFAERNKGEFKDYFITFSSKPQLQKIEGDSLFRRVNNLKKAHWEMNTDIQAVFDLILDRAKAKNLHYTNMPSKIVIISDMEFDVATHKGEYNYYGEEASQTKTNFEVIEEKYAEAGYVRPELVFWNVNSYGDQSPITINDEGVKLVSGASPSIFKSLMADKTVSAYDLMLEVLNQKRYDIIEEMMDG